MHDYRRFVQQLLDDHGWTPGGFARRAGMHRQTITKIVNDPRDHLGQMPDDSTMQGIADGFGIDVARVRQAAARSLAGYVEPDEQQPTLPRNAPQAEVLGSLAHVLGPAIKRGLSAETSPKDRQFLTSVRNKLLHAPGADAGFTDDESRALARFIEEDELATLHARIDWLPRAEQLQVSELVNALALDVENRWRAEGYTNESKTLPDYAQPNPLLREGLFPSATGSDSTDNAEPRSMLSHFSTGQDAGVLGDEDREQRDERLGG